MTIASFHTVKQAEAALATGAPSLVTTPGAAAFAGPAYLAEAFHQAQQAHPKSHAEAWIDCGDDSGMVLRAIRAGWTHIVFMSRGPIMERVTDICRQSKVEIRSIRTRSGRKTNSTAKKARLRS